MWSVITVQYISTHLNKNKLYVLGEKQGQNFYSPHFFITLDPNQFRRDTVRLLVPGRKYHLTFDKGLDVVRYGSSPMIVGFKNQCLQYAFKHYIFMYSQ